MGARGQWGREQKERNLTLDSALNGAARDKRHWAPQAQVGPRQVDSLVVETNLFSYTKHRDRVLSLLREAKKVNITFRSTESTLIFRRDVYFMLHASNRLHRIGTPPRCKK